MSLRALSLGSTDHPFHDDDLELTVEGMLLPHPGPTVVDVRSQASKGPISLDERSTLKDAIARWLDEQL